MVRRLLPLFAVLVLVTPASATTLTFSHFESSGWQSSARLPGVTLRGATTENGQVHVGSADVAHTRYRGLSVASSDDTGAFDGSDLIDSHGANDAIVFEFDRAVRLERISFSATSWTDRFDVFLGDDLTYQRTYKADDLSGSDWVSTVLLGSGYEGTRFAIGASEYQSCGYSIAEGHSCWSENSAFRITGITFSEVELASVPLPPSALLMLTVLGFVALQRRRSATA